MEVNNTPILSIIIPVYNVELYLKDCLDSILNQNSNDYEIILVDDGSTDSSGIICDEYTNKYSNMKVIHNSNGGLSDARNSGFKIAKGKYILFIDSDDFIEPESLKNIIKYTDSNVDIIFLDAYKYFNNKSIKKIDTDFCTEKLKINNKDILLDNISHMNKFTGSACSKAIRREFLLDNNISFESNITMEDIDWNLKILTKVNTSDYYSGKYYYYRQNRKNSITNSINENTFKYGIKIIKKWQNFNDNINSILAYEYIILLANSYVLKDKNLKNELYSLSWLLKYKNNKKVFYSYIAYKIFGIRILSKLLEIYLKIISIMQLENQ